MESASRKGEDHEEDVRREEAIVFESSESELSSEVVGDEGLGSSVRDILTS